MAEYADGLVPRLHRIDMMFDDKRLICSAQGATKIDLMSIVVFFVRHPPTPVSRPDPLPTGKKTKAAKQEWELALFHAQVIERYEIQKEVDRIVKEADLHYGEKNFVPVAELKSFLLDVLQEPTDRAYVESFSFADLAEGVARQWNERVNVVKNQEMAAFEDRKRRFDALFVDQDKVKEQRPWKRARKDDM
jgi:hypothetical protein